MKTSVSRIVKAFALYRLDMLIKIDDIINDLNVILQQQHGAYLSGIKKIVKIENTLLILNELKSFDSFEGYDDDDDNYAHANNTQLQKLKVQQLKAI